jgi:hypothetical protein
MGFSFIVIFLDLITLRLREKEITSTVDFIFTAIDIK